MPLGMKCSTRKLFFYVQCKLNDVNCLVNDKFELILFTLNYLFLQPISYTRDYVMQQPRLFHETEDFVNGLFNAWIASVLYKEPWANKQRMKRSQREREISLCYMQKFTSTSHPHISLCVCLLKVPNI